MCDTVAGLEKNMSGLSCTVDVKLTRLDQVLTKLAIRLTVLRGEKFA
jgi:hypothetical protein